MKSTNIIDILLLFLLMFFMPVMAQQPLRTLLAVDTELAKYH